MMKFFIVKNNDGTFSINVKCYDKIYKRQKLREIYSNNIDSVIIFKVSNIYDNVVLTQYKRETFYYSFLRNACFSLFLMRQTVTIEFIGDSSVLNYSIVSCTTACKVAVCMPIAARRWNTQSRRTNIHVRYDPKLIRGVLKNSWEYQTLSIRQRSPGCEIGAETYGGKHVVPQTRIKEEAVYTVYMLRRG